MAISLERIFYVLDILQSRSLVSAGELTARLEIDGRSLRRVMVQLQRLGIPIESVRGRYGGYRLRPGATLPPLMLKDEEALVLALGALMVQQMGLGAADSIVTETLMKLRRVIPATLQEHVYALQAAVTVDILPVVAAPPLAMLLLLSRCAYRRQRARLHYVDKHGNMTERDFDCYGVVCHQSVWYAVGWCELRHDMRILRIDRIVQALPGDATYAAPQDFDCLAFTVQHFAAIPDTWHIQVELDETLERLRALVPPTFATLEASSGGVQLRAYDRDLAHMARFLVNLGCPFRVLAPAELCDQLRHLAAAIQRYAQDV